MGWLLLFVVVVLGVPAAAYLAQDRMLFLPRLAAPPGAMRPAAPVGEIALPSANGRQVAGGGRGARPGEGTRSAPEGGPPVRGWLAGARGGGPAPLIVYYGGNAEDATGQAFEPWPADWARALVNYPGDGAGEGPPSERALCADAEVVL